MSWFEDAQRLAAATMLVREKVDDPTLAAWRMSICRSCDQFDAEHIKCRVCGCWLELKTESKVNRSPKRPLGEVTHCPLGKWNDEEIAAYYHAQDQK